MPSPSLRQILIGASLVVASSLATAGLFLYINRHEFFEMPGLMVSQTYDWHSPQQQEGQNGKDALEMYWANDLVKGKPYSADVTTSTTEELADGNRIRTTATNRFYRDSQGRVRLDKVTESAPVQIDARTMIDDPVANKSYILLDKGGSEEFDSSRSQEFLAKFAQRKGLALLSLPKLDSAKQIQQEGLGVREIEGMTCRGMRERVTIPAGLAGNDRAIAIMVEVWYAPSIASVVQSSVHDPRFGQIDYKLSHVQLTDSPVTLFAAPFKHI